MRKLSLFSCFCFLFLLPLLANAQVISGGSSDSADYPAYKAGQYMLPLGSQTHGSGAAATANSMRCSIGRIGRAITVSQLFVRVTAGGASSNMQQAIYAVDPVSKMPGVKLGATGSGSGASVTMVSTALTANAALRRGAYWFCFNSDSTGESVSVLTSAQNTHNQMVGSSSLSTALIGTTTLNTGVVATQTFGTWPADASSLTWADANVVPAIGFLVASVP